MFALSSNIETSAKSIPIPSNWLNRRMPEMYMTLKVTPNCCGTVGIGCFGLMNVLFDRARDQKLRMQILALAHTWKRWLNSLSIKRYPSCIYFDCLYFPVVIKRTLLWELCSSVIVGISIQNIDINGNVLKATVFATRCIFFIGCW